MKSQTTNQYPLNVSTHGIRCTTSAAQWFLMVPFLFILAACSSPENSLTLPFNSDIISRYYYKDSLVTEFFLKPEYEEKTVRITPQEASVPIKGWQFAGAYGMDDGALADYRYYEIGQFHLDDRLYKLIMYNCIGVSDARLLNTQLNSYAPNGDLQDALILEYLFGYEEYNFFSKFTVDENTVVINYYSTRTYNLDRPPGEEIIENPVPELYLTERYKIDNGFFKLLHREEYDLWRQFSM